MKITVSHVSGTNREVADRARTTIGLGEGTKQVSNEYMRKLYLCEHSPIRTQHYRIKMEDVPYWVVMHLVRHNVGISGHFVSTQRTDRTGEDRNSKSQDALVMYEVELNAQAIINISRRRLCNCASKETRKVWQMVVDELRKINEPLAQCCVADCIYRNWCYEHKTCGYHLTNSFNAKVNEYREGINLWKSGEISKDMKESIK